MSSPAAFGVRRPVVANLVMFAIIGAGLIFGVSLRREFFPRIEPREVLVIAPYPGAAPDEVERSLAIKIEDRVADLSDVVEINTVVREGLATVRIEFEEGVSIDRAVADVKREVDALQDLPEEADRIVVDRLEANLPAIVLALYGDADERVMKETIRQIREDLRTIPGMGDITIAGTRRDEIVVEVRPEAALEHGLSLPEVSERVRAAMLELPGGAVRSPTANVAVRTVGVAQRVDAVRRIVVKAGADGQVLRLEDIADVSDGFVDVDLRTRLNGEPSVSLTVFRVGDQDTVRMAAMVKAYAAGRRGEPIDRTVGERARMLLTPPGRAGTEPVSARLQAYEVGLSRFREAPVPGELVVTTDLARFVVDRLELLARNALYGGLLVFLVLVLLLNWRVSFWVALGLVVSMLGALTVMSLTGITLNLLTMFGLIIVIGILVDDAIVVAENITARHERGEPAMVAAVNGTHQVAWPVVATVLTTICAFLPLALIDGQIGDFMKWLPLVVGVALLVSLVECLFILPSHMAHSLRTMDKHRAAGMTRLERVEAWFDGWRDALFGRVIIPWYLQTLRVCLRYRYLTTAGAIALMIVSLGMVAGGRLEFILFEAEDSETVTVDLTMPIGTPTSETDRVLRRLERAALNQPEVMSVWAQAGARSDIGGEGGDAEQSHLGQLILELHPVEKRVRTSEDVRQSIRDEVGVLPGIKSLRMEEISGGPGGPAITLTVVGDRQASIEGAAAMLSRKLGGFDGVRDIATDLDVGQRELRFTLREGASELGFTQVGLGRQVQAAVFGLDAYTFAGDQEDGDGRVRSPERVRRSLAALESMYVFSAQGLAVPLGEVARMEEVEGYATVRRLDRRRAVTVTADVDRRVANPDAVAQAVKGVFEDVEGAFPGVRILERGRQKEFNDSFSTLPLGMAVAAGLIYVVLAWLFGSYVQPLAVMAAIPFALIGMIWGHMLLGFSLTFLSLIGFIALAGVVVNDSLIFMQFFNQERAAGKTVMHASLCAGRARVRAILLTTITTVFGLLPLMLEQSFQARFLIPMAITIACGLISATAIILIVLPCLLMIMADGKRGLWILWHGRIPRGPHHEEAPHVSAVLPARGVVRSPDKEG